MCDEFAICLEQHVSLLSETPKLRGRMPTPSRRSCRTLSTGGSGVRYPTSHTPLQRELGVTVAPRLFKTFGKPLAGFPDEDEKFTFWDPYYLDILPCRLARHYVRDISTRDEERPW